MTPVVVISFMVWAVVYKTPNAIMCTLPHDCLLSCVANNRGTTVFTNSTKELGELREQRHTRESTNRKNSENLGDHSVTIGCCGQVQMECLIGALWLTAIGGCRRDTETATTERRSIATGGARLVEANVNGERQNRILVT